VPRVAKSEHSLCRRVNEIAHMGRKRRNVIEGILIRVRGKRKKKRRSFTWSLLSKYGERRQRIRMEGLRHDCREGDVPTRVLFPGLT